MLSEPSYNKSVEQYWNELFIENWFIAINYTNYFEQCAAAFCTYTIVDTTNFSYAITFILSIYGGLTVLLRLIAYNSLKLVLKNNRRVNDTSILFQDFLHLFHSMLF